VYNTGTVSQAGHVEMAWTDESHLFWDVLPVAPIAVYIQKRSESSDKNHESGNKDYNSIVRLPCGYLYHSRH